MKLRYLIKTFFIMLMCMLAIQNKTYAMNTGFTTREAPLEKAENFRKAVDLKVVNEIDQNSEIICFDINEDGLVAIGLDGNFDRKEVGIYSSEGVFLYGYSFNSSGTYGLEWDKENIVLSFRRGDIAGVFNKAGECLEVRYIIYNEENTSYWEEIYNKDEIKYGEDRFILENSPSPFRQYIVLKKISGQTQDEKVIYNATLLPFLRDFVILFIALIAWICVVVGLPIYIKKHYRYNKKKVKK